MTKTVKNDSKINSVLDRIDGLDVRESKQDLMTMLESRDSYMFSFSENQRLETGQVPYAFYILEDGTFIFTFDDVNSVREKPLITTENHKELLKDIKRDLEVTF
ncbi:hypothetical protein [Halobacillus andaensis]|uniref:hypothetical protein n=1 Tax=Halobacillus andaensis TaxID=1176239 RepID=UPI003D738636